MLSNYRCLKMDFQNNICETRKKKGENIVVEITGYHERTHFNW